MEICVDSGLVLLFSLLDSLGSVGVLVARDVDGQDWLGRLPEGRLRKIDVRDAEEGDPVIKKFLSSTIERVEVMGMVGAWSALEERGVLLVCSHGELVIGVGLDREDAMCDYPGIMLLSDVPPNLMARIERVVLVPVEE